ncbi:protein rhomboid isoform X1 [Drosophila sulfurigaster albostrigata]|uniref:Protein rhomboid isoform X1 n=2 Tax=Drosophila albomicans TaxID=7291 RepID=A0A6P8X775_DROAB|nr:protein rhomboid isoform X1 [Drosophila albomicans]XP_060655964.1 protein rhomboid isoform X1 [Drosophila nasuta]XP_062131297.1 protein rhomboid isoform X1 [Drosophila sulfurigaster albostrigata]
MWPGSERGSSRALELPTSQQNAGGSSQQETLADIEHISTIAGSLASIGSLSHTQMRYCTNDAGYDTEHTSLNSDFDEAELKRELLRDKWKLLFDMFDPEGFGEISVTEFLVALKSPEFLSQVPMNKRELLLERAKKAQLPNGPGYVTFQDFVNVMSGKRTRSFKCAVHQRDREVCSENDFQLVLSEPPLFRKMVHAVAVEVLPEERDRKYYADRYTCCPPPFFIILITMIELAFFVYHTMAVGETAAAGPVPTDSMFIYRPDKRHEIWRFVLYMVLHAGWFHLGFNVAVQLLFGLPLEMVHGSTRIACIYFSGVLAGSLGTSIFDPEVYLVGASGGVYALLAAHLANVLLNYHQMRYGVIRLAFILIFASFDFGFAIYARYAGEDALPNQVGANAASVSYVAHLAGAVAGLTIGLLVLKNFEQKLHEQLLWWIALGTYMALVVFAVAFNILHGVTLFNMRVEKIRVTETFYNDFKV